MPLEPISRTDWSGVRDRIDALRRHPSHDQVFGSKGHGFQLEPRLTPADVADVESTLGIALPADYRSFLTDVGAGGAGPFYGLFPLRRGAVGWEWHGDGAELTDRSRLGEPFPVERVPAGVLAELLAVRPKPNDFETEEELDDAFDNWDERLEALLYQPSMSVGAICLTDEGCAYRDWLVVTGPAAGTMWEDPRCLDQDFKPIQPGRNFRDWFLDWLAASEHTVVSSQHKVATETGHGAG
jgi:hypothetical protein